MATEFNDDTHYGLFFGGGTLSSSTSFKVRQSELTLAAMRAGGLLDNMVDGTSPPATDKFWLDKNTDPATLKEWDSIGLAWIPITFDRIFGRAVVTAMGTVTGTADAIIAPAPPAFIDKRLYSITPIATNTGAVTVQVPGYGTFPLTYPNGSAVTKGELETGKPAVTLFQNGRFELLIGYGPAVKAELWANVAAAFAAITSGAGFATREELKNALALADFEGSAYVTIDGEMVVIALDGGPLDHLNDGQIVFANGLGYKRATGSTVIPDIPGWIPVDPVTPLHFDVVNDGVIDCTPGWNAFQALTGYRKEVQAGDYLVGDPIPEDGKPYLVLAAGQSNMVGFSGTTGGTFPSNANVHMWLSLTNGGVPQWIQNPNFATTTYFVPIAATATYHELGGGKSNAALAFAHRLQRASGRPVWLILDGLGGASIDDWVVGGVSAVRYASLKANVTAALPGIVGAPDKVQFFLWQQGEADYLDAPSVHTANMNVLYDQLSAEAWWDTNTRFIAGLPVQTNSLYEDLTSAVRAFVAEDPDLRQVAETEGIPVTGDNVHFTGPGLYTLGNERYWFNPVEIKRFSNGVVGNGEFDDTDAAWDQPAGDRERRSIIVHQNVIDVNSEPVSPIIKTQTRLHWERSTPQTDFKHVVGEYHEATYTGFHNVTTDTNQNFTISGVALKNLMAGLQGGLAQLLYVEDTSHLVNPLIATISATKNGCQFQRFTRYALYIHKGYMFGTEIYCINDAPETLDVPYANNDEFAFTSWTAGIKIAADGRGAPISAAIFTHGLGAKHGFQNGIVVGGSGFISNNDNQGPAGTIAISLASHRTANGFSDIGIKFRHNNRQLHFREDAKVEAPTWRHINRDASAVISLESMAGSSSSLSFGDGATSAANPTITERARITGSSATLLLSSSAGNVQAMAGGSGYTFAAGALYPNSSGVRNLGITGTNIWDNIFAANATITASDRRLKDEIRPIDDDLLDAWDGIRWMLYKMRSAIAAKGSAARIHAGLIAQDVEEALNAAGLSAFDYGLIGMDTWEAQPEKTVLERILISPDEYEQVLMRHPVDRKPGDEAPPYYEEWVDGPNLIKAAVYEERLTVVSEAIEAGEGYSVRYSEALVIEAAYQRRRADRSDDRATAIESRLSALEALAGAN